MIVDCLLSLGGSRGESKKWFCLVSVSVLTQKSATCHCMLLIFNCLDCFVLHEGFEPSILRLRI